MTQLKNAPYCGGFKTPDQTIRIWKTAPVIENKKLRTAIESDPRQFLKGMVDESGLNYLTITCQLHTFW